MEIKVGVSNRHIHITEETYKKLFGTSNIEMERKLTQSLDFASTSKIILKTDKNIITDVRVIGPFRKYNQVEISKTDAYFLGLNPPIRESGDLDNSESITLVGKKGEIKVENCCIICNRHIHLSPIELQELGLNENDKVSVKINNETGGIIDNISLKVQDDFHLELHLDTDHANTFNLKNDDYVELIK